MAARLAAALPLRRNCVLSPSILRFVANAAAGSEGRFTRLNSPVPCVVDHTPVLSTPATKITTLRSGLRVATESHLASETATVGVWIDAGSRYETEATNGTAHFLEHMIFKGTEKRSQWSLEEEIENIGGHLNAYTSREHTTYYAKVMKKDIVFAIDVLADILQNSCFREDRIERERSVILREMQEVESQMEEVIFDHLHAAAFQGSQIGRTILGPAENIRSITKGNLQDYISTHYTGPRMVIAAAGAVEHEEVANLADKLFTSLSTNPTTALEFLEKKPAVFTGSEVRIRDDNMPFAHIAVAVMGATWTDPDSMALMVMQTMLGAWNKSTGAGKHMGSELAHMVAANNIAESVIAFNTSYTDTGLFGVYAVAQPNVLDGLAYAIMHELTRMIYRVLEEDLVRAKNKLKACLLLHLDGTSPITEDIGRQLLCYGRRLSLAEFFARIDAVDVETVKRVANRFIYDKEIAIAAMGAIQKLPDYNWFRRRTYWLRY